MVDLLDGERVRDFHRCHVEVVRGHEPEIWHTADETSVDIGIELVGTHLVPRLAVSAGSH